MTIELNAAIVAARDQNATIFKYLEIGQRFKFNVADTMTHVKISSKQYRDVTGAKWRSGPYSKVYRVNQ